jgi:hypothetical protein
MTRRVASARFNRTLLAATCAGIVAAALAVPQSAYAWWRPHVGVGISIPLVVPGPPVYYPPPPAYAYYGPPPVYYRPPPRVWVPPHRNWAGAWIPGHWVWR